jgi:very-short-patch-repair endonuclease
MSLNEKCWICGADIRKSYGATDVISFRFCREHWLEHQREYKHTVSEYLKLKTQVMFERAMRKMDNAGVFMTNIQREAQAVQKHSIDCPEAYKSSDEMIAAVIMLSAGYDFELNYKIGRYIVDMYLPDLKLILEVDGERHENRHLQDSKRDTELRRILGDEWEVIRIPTQYIEQNPAKIPDAVIALAKQKRELRKKNGGFLPQSYSKREAAKYEKAMIYDEIHVKA